MVKHNLSKYTNPTYWHSFLLQANVVGPSYATHVCLTWSEYLKHGLCMWEHFTNPEHEFDEEGEETLKTKKATLLEGPNCIYRK